MIALLAPVIATTVKGLCLSFLSEKVLQEVVFILLRKLVASTENTLDDKILKAYESNLSK
ncbi:MAG: hypothetical protein HOE64_17215 [Nitrospina sp.]|nr:hypothetical protein [Nitrospina sp.]